MRAAELATRLADDAEGVCRYLLPNGKREGREWRAGDVSGGEGKSLGVNLNTGVWKDFASGDRGGDLIDLWAACENLSIGEAIKAAKDYLGISDPTFHGEQPRSYTRPDKPKCTAPRNGVLAWLTDDRGLSLAAVDAYKLAEAGDFVVFPSMRDGQLVRWKRRHKDDKHKCQTSSDSEPCLFGWQAIPPDARSVTICEGEIDAVSWWQMGYPALSVPNGAQGHTWIEAEYDNLERFDTIFVSMDNDAAGQKAVAEIVDRLGRERCRVVEIPEPHKDANDLLLAHVDVKPLVAAAKTQDPAELRSAAEFVDEVVREFYPPDDVSIGVVTPWQKIGRSLMFRYGEVTVLAGANGHGKSEIACQMVLDAAWQGDKACIASMEFKPRRWLWRMTRQCGGLSEPSIPYIREIHDWYSGKLWVFDTVGTAKADRVLEVFAYARRRYGIRLFLIDNLAKCGFDEDDYNGQKGFVDKLTDFAKDDDVHVILVAHLRKAQDENHVGNKFDVKGSGAITDMVDNVLVIWRNKGKEDKAREGKADDATPDALLICNKQRNGDEEPRISLWFDRESKQFLEFRNASCRQYVEFSGGKIGKDGQRKMTQTKTKIGIEEYDQMKNIDYQDFIERKLHEGANQGFEPTFMPDSLFDFQRELTAWSIEKGRCALFEDCGLGKTVQELVWAENVHRHTNKSVLILAPLAVTAQTVREGDKFGIECNRARDGRSSPGIVLTNYEQLHKFNPSDYAGVVCDESSILKSFDGTRRREITEFVRKVPYRLLATATAAPNDYIELGTSSEALGYLGHMDMLNRFFKNDNNNSGMKRMYGEAPKWRFKAHSEQPFWRWVTSWSRAIRKPSDFGFDDDGFILPRLIQREHVVESETVAEGMLFALPAIDLRDQREESKRTIRERCEKVADLVDTNETALIWCHRNDEGNLLQKLIPDSVQVSRR